MVHRMPLRARGVLAEQRPRRLVHEDHRLIEELGTKPIVRRPKHPREGFDLIVERLGIDDQTLTLHDPDLPLERKVVGVLRDGDGDREREAVAAAGNETRRKERGLDALAAAAAVLLPDVLLDYELARDDVDLFTLLDLTAHLRKRAVTQDADAVCLGDIVSLFNDAKLFLLARSVSRLWLALLRRRRRLVRAAFGALPEEHPILLLELRLKAFELHLESDAVFALGREESLRELHHASEQSAILRFKEDDRLTEDLGILLALEVDAHDDDMLDADRHRKILDAGSGARLGAITRTGTMAVRPAGFVRNHR